MIKVERHGIFLCFLVFFGNKLVHVHVDHPKLVHIGTNTTKISIAKIHRGKKKKNREDQLKFSYLLSLISRLSN